jgi:hypothetical protein
MTRRDPDQISLGAKELAERLSKRLGGQKPSAVLQFDCVARGKMLSGLEVKTKGIDVIQDMPWLGFFTYGELAPIGGKN